MCSAVQTELGKFECDQKSVEIFFSAHGVPKSYVEEAGDPYKVRTLNPTMYALVLIFKLDAGVARLGYSIRPGTHVE